MLSNPGIVTIFVGMERLEFAIHKALLCVTSMYFKAVLSGGSTAFE